MRSRKPCGTVALSSDTVDDDDGIRYELPIAVLFEPVQGLGSCACSVQRRAEDQHELVGLGQQPLVGAVENPCPGGEDDQVVVAVQQGDNLPVCRTGQGRGEARNGTRRRGPQA